MTNRTTCDIWLCIDEDGDYAIGTDAESARTAYDDEYTSCGAIALVHLIADCPLPRAIECRIVLPEPPEQPVNVSVEPH